MKTDVFLSYSTADRSSAEALCHHLEQAGIRCWMAPRDVPAGVDWPDAISAAIEDATVFVVVFTSDTATSRHVKSEVRQAFDAEKIIVPVRLAPVKPTGGYDHLLGNSHWIDTFPDGLDSHANSIVRTIEAVLGHGDSTTETVRSVAAAAATKDLVRGSQPRSLETRNSAESRIDNPPPKEFLYGTWECRKIELGQEVKILWSLNPDSTTTYRGYQAGQTAYIPSSVWSYSDGLLYEEFETGATGRSIVKALTDEFELTIVDNDTLLYRGVKRVYRRVADNAEQDQFT